MHMRKARSSGFTIIEVLIVLVVTGLLFLSATALISGRTDQTDFEQSSRDFQQQIQAAINQVESGTYTGTTENCTPGTPLTFSGNNYGQGTDEDCIFIGDLLEFGVGANQQGINTYTLAGLRQQANGKEMNSLANADPTIVPLSSGGADVTPSTLEYGLHPYTAAGQSSMSYSVNGSGLTSIGAFALVYSFASYTGGGNIESGSQQIDVVPLVGSTLGESLANLKADVASELPLSPDTASGTQVFICAMSGTTNQDALVTIGGTNNGGSNNGQLGVTLTILNSSTKNKACPQ